MINPKNLFSLGLMSCALEVRMGRSPLVLPSFHVLQVWSIWFCYGWLGQICFVSFLCYVYVVITSWHIRNLILFSVIWSNLFCFVCVSPKKSDAYFLHAWRIRSIHQMAQMICLVTWSNLFCFVCDSYILCVVHVVITSWHKRYLVKFIALSC